MSGLNELLDDLESSLKDIRAERKAYQESQKAKDQPTSDLITIRLQNLEGQLIKNISKIRLQMEQMKPQAPTDETATPEIEGLYKDKKFLADMEKAMMKHIEREMDSGPIDEKGSE